MQFWFLKGDLPTIFVQPISIKMFPTIIGLKKEYSGGYTSWEVGVALNHLPTYGF